MENSFYLYSNHKNLAVERFQICSWDFRNRTGMTEFGIEIKSSSISSERKIGVSLYIPWIGATCITEDLYSRLKDLENSKFIFNDLAISHKIFDEKNGQTGCLQEFKGRDNLFLIPVNREITTNVLHLDLNLESYQDNRAKIGDSNIYVRIGVHPQQKKSIALKRSGLNKTTYIFDIKINEKRNLPSNINPAYTCSIEQAFYFNIIPNDFALIFFDSSSLKGVRTLEYNGFKNFLSDERLQENDLMVVSCKDTGKNSYSFFNVFSHEILGVGVLALALLLNLLCGILLFLPSLRGDSTDSTWRNLPWELYGAIAIWILVLFYFLAKRFNPNLIKW